MVSLYVPKPSGSAEHKYRYNRIITARYEEFELLDAKYRNNPDVISMWGDRYWQPTPKWLIDDLIEIARSYDSEQEYVDDAYEPWWPGDFKDAVTEKLRLSNNIKLDNPEKQIGLTHGAAGGFAAACGIFLQDGDEALVLAPQFTFAWGIPDLLGAKTIPVPIKEENDWTLTPGEVPDLLEPLITKKTKMMISTIPGNPTGTLFSKATTKAIGDILRDHEILYLEDNVYERRIYDDYKYVPMASIPGMLDWTISLMGFSKIYNVGSFRVGYVVSNEDIVDKIWRWYMLGSVSPSNLFRKVLAKAFRRDMAGPLPPPWHEANRKEWDKMRHLTYDMLKEIPGVSLSLPRSGTFHFINISKLGTSDEIHTYMREKYKVLLTPGRWYGPGGHGYVRLCYATNVPKRTIEGVNRTIEGLTKLAKQKGIT
jgi:aminotransferase